MNELEQLKSRCESLQRTNEELIELIQIQRKIMREKGLK
jgi:hypothetical protein